MESATNTIKNYLETVFDGNASLAPNIEEKTLRAAAGTYQVSAAPRAIIGLYESKSLGRFTAGMAFTGTAVYYKNGNNDPVSFRYDELEDVTYDIEDKKTTFGKDREERVVVNLANGNRIHISDLEDCNYEKLKELFQELAEGDYHFEEVDQLTPVSGQSEDFKLLYLKIIANMAYTQKGEVTPHEFAEIMALVQRIELSDENRWELRSYLTSGDSAESNEELFRRFDAALPGGQETALRFSLLKDLISIYAAAHGEPTKNFQFLNDIWDYLQLEEDNLDIALETIELDRQLLYGNLSESEVKKRFSQLGSQASAVGVPVASIYLSGSVMGLSASSITSGLSALGMGGVLGLSSMVTGIGTVVLLGVGTYKTMEYVLSTGEREKSLRRDFLIKEAIKQKQRTISLIISDVNYLVGKINDQIAKTARHELQLDHLVKQLTQISGAAEDLKGQVSTQEAALAAMRCPETLDPQRLAALASKAGNEEAYDAIGAYYKASDETGSEGDSEEVWTLRDDLNADELDRLGDMLEEIGFGSARDVAKDTVSKTARNIGKKIRRGK